MMRIAHALAEEFSEHAALIAELRKTDHDFGRMAADYEEVNAAIFRIESGEEPTSDEVLEELKKRRIVLKDRINARLHRATAPATGRAGRGRPRARSDR